MDLKWTHFLIFHLCFGLSLAPTLCEIHLVGFAGTQRGVVIVWQGTSSMHGAAECVLVTVEIFIELHLAMRNFNWSTDSSSPTHLSSTVVLTHVPNPLQSNLLSVFFYFYSLSTQ